MVEMNRLYKGKTIQEFLQEISPTELITEFKRYLGKIMQLDVKIENGILARERYLDEKTTDLTMELLELFGEKHPKEIILLLSEQEYTLIIDISKRYNLLKYFIQHMDLIQKLQSKEVYEALSTMFHYSTHHLYGKNVYISYGNGSHYYGFLNDMFSKHTFENGLLCLDFCLKIDIVHYDILKLGSALGINQKILKKLKETNAETELLERGVDRRFLLREEEQKFKRALNQYVKELNNIVSQQYLNILVKMESRFDIKKATHPIFDQTQNYFITFKKRVEITDNYEETRLHLINTIKTFNKLENQYFAIDYMNQKLTGLIERYKEKSENQKPLFQDA